MSCLSKQSLSLIVAVLLTACSGQIDTAPSPLAKMTPESWNEWVVPDANNYISWSAFKDPELEKLLNFGLKNSLSIESTQQRMQAAELRLTASGATRLPYVSASATASQSGQLDGGRDSFYSTSLSATYEIDMWGRRGQRIKQSALNVEDAEIAMQSARISLAATIADNYFNIRALDKKLTLQDKFLTSAHAQRKLIEARFKAGLVIRTDLDRQDVQIADIETRIEEQNSRRIMLVNSLAVVLGEIPGKFEVTINNSHLLDAPKLAPATPAEILRNRPDIKFSEIDLEQSFINAELVRTNLYPSFSLSAGADTSSSAIDGLFSSISLPWTAITRATLPLLDGKARETELKLTELGHSQVITNYKRTILSAIQDVESALSRQASIALQKESFTRKLASQQRVSNDTQEKYKRGKASAFDLLNDSTILIGFEQQEVDIWLSSMMSTIGLLRAFGVDPTE